MKLFFSSKSLFLFHLLIFQPIKSSSSFSYFFLLFRLFLLQFTSPHQKQSFVLFVGSQSSVLVKNNLLQLVHIFTHLILHHYLKNSAHLDFYVPSQRSKMHGNKFMKVVVYNLELYSLFNAIDERSLRHITYRYEAQSQNNLEYQDKLLIDLQSLDQIQEQFTKNLKGQQQRSSMNQQLHSHLTRDDGSDNWEEKCRILVQKLVDLEHQHKKVSIEVRNDLEFQRKRANQFEEKYKSAIKYRDEQQQLKLILEQLNETLTMKENQLLEYIKSDQDKKKKISDLDNINEELLKNNQQIRLQLNQIQQGAISAILQKDSIIQQLEDKLITFENIDINGMQGAMIQLQDRHRELEDQAEAEKRQLEGIIQMKDEQIRQIRDKLDLQRERYEDKINSLQQQIFSYEKHIESLHEQRSQEQNIEQKYYQLEQKHRKAEKKLQDFESAYKIEKQDLIDIIQKLEQQIASKAQMTEELKSANNKIRQFEKQLKTKKKDIEEAKSGFEKTKNDYLRKITQLEQEKKKAQDLFDAKSSEYEKLKSQVDEQKKVIEFSTPEKKDRNVQKDASALSADLDPPILLNSASKKQSSEQTNALIEKLKAQIREKEEHIDELNLKLSEEMKEAQTLRQKLVTTSGSASRSQGQTKLLVQIQDLNSYIKKVQHNLMITKLKYAEDENYWSSRESQLKKEMQKLDKKAKKQKAQLIERIDRMKKTTVKDKKTDYYQSSLK